MTYEIDAKTYEKLYAKYLRGNRTKEMVDLAGDLKGKKVLDLCCGNCRLSKEVLKRKPEFVSAVDSSYQMLDPIFPYRKVGDPPLNKIIMRVDEALSSLKPGSFNAIFCQQAINYWFRSDDAKIIKKILAPKGVFIFNTFNETPSISPLTKNYRCGKRSFTEVSWMVKDMVKHVQIAEGMDPHFTEFRWIHPDVFKRAFKNAGINVEVKTDRNTDIYVCRKG
jgi:SAM-dependent methyltransferase